MQLNRQQRRALKKAKPQKEVGYIELPITFRFSDKDETSLILQPMLCAEKLRDGTAEEPDWHTVVLRLNWARLLNQNNFNEGEDCIAQAQEAMKAIKAVGDSSGIWKAEPEQFSAISEALAMAIEMQKLCTRRELRDALEAVYEANEYHNKVNQIKNKLKAQP